MTVELVPRRHHEYRSRRRSRLASTARARACPAPFSSVRSGVGVCVHDQAPFVVGARTRRCPHTLSVAAPGVILAVRVSVTLPAHAPRHSAVALRASSDPSATLVEWSAHEGNAIRKRYFGTSDDTGGGLRPAARHGRPSKKLSAKLSRMSFTGTAQRRISVRHVAR